MRRGAHGVAVALALAGCQPVFYELLGGSSTEGTGSTGQGAWTLSDPTAPDPTGEATGPPLDPCFGEDGAPRCGGLCPPCPPGLPCEGPKDCETGLCFEGICEAPQCEFAGDCPQEPCRAAECDPVSRRCVFFDLDGSPCEDDDLCTELGVCFAGECQAKPRDCGFLDAPCRAGFCNPQNGNCGVEFVDEGGSCEDGDPCTMFEVCMQGQCVGKPPPAPFFDDFSQWQGWTLGDLWAIGPAAPSSCVQLGGEDPAEDHSPGFDDMLAGALIGDCLPDKPLPMDACLTSPPIDTTGPGPLFLSYWSRLTSASAPAGARVEVWTGQQWATLFDSKGEVVDEPTWTPHVHDVTFFKGPAMQVRFCHHHPVAGLPLVAGWSVDDVHLGLPECAP